MKGFSFAIMLIALLGLVGCQSANNAYEKCIDKYEQQRDQNGGNGGFVDPERFCKKWKP